MEDLFAHLSDSLPAATALMLLVLLLARTQRTAARRHLILMTGLLISAALPIFHDLLPKWRVLPHWVSTTHLNNFTEAPTAVLAQGIDWITVITALWMAGISIFATRTGVGFCRLLYRERETFDPACPRIDAIADRCRNSTSSNRSVRILMHPEYRMPMTWGWLRPQVWLPLEAEEWTDEELECVLLHEMAHIERRDFLMELVTRMVLAVYWFHPLAWAISRRMELAKEMACDDRVLLAGKTAGNYAASLANLGAGLRLPHEIPETAAGFFGRKPLLARALGITDPWQERANLTRADFIQITTPLALIAVMTGSLGFKAMADIRNDQQQIATTGRIETTPSLWSDLLAPAARSIHEIATGHRNRPKLMVTTSSQSPATTVPIPPEPGLHAALPVPSAIAQMTSGGERSLTASFLFPRSSESTLPRPLVKRPSSFLIFGSRKERETPNTVPPLVPGENSTSADSGSQSPSAEQPTKDRSPDNARTVASIDNYTTRKLKASANKPGAPVTVAFLVVKSIDSSSLRPEVSYNLHSWQPLDSRSISMTRSTSDSLHDQITYEISPGNQPVRFYRIAQKDVPESGPGRGLEIGSGSSDRDALRRLSDDEPETPQKKKEPGK